MSEIRSRAIGAAAAGLLGALFATVRERRLGAEYFLRLRAERTPIIFVFWHAHTLPLAHVHRNEGIITLVSEHPDGELLVRLIRHWGFDAVRGSGARGAVKAIRGLVRAAREGRDLALTPDGPPGPARVFQLGAISVAQATGFPIVPLAAAASRAWRPGSRNRLLVPQPFARVCVAYGSPRTVPPELNRTAVAALARDFGRELDRLEEEAAACATH